VKKTWQITILTWAILACSLGQAQTPPPVPTILQSEPAPEWNAKFAGAKGWIGGDGVYTAVLDHQRVLWLFGDTLLGAVKDGKRAGAIMVNNTIGLQTGRDEDAAIRFRAGKGKDDKPAAFFTPTDGKGWFWPQAAVREGERLFVFLTQIDKTKDPGVFGFRLIGQWLAVIDNVADEPRQWRIKQHPLPFARFEQRRAQSWGSAVLAEGAHLYVYGYQEQGKEIGSRKLLLARVPTDKLTDFTAWRFRTSAGWSEKAEEATPLAGGLATEFSVQRMPDGKGYALVYTENGLGDRIVGRFARAAWGPWSAAVLLYRCPEMAKDKGVFCYAAKSHSWAAKDDELLISYCVNTWEFARLFREETVYRPKFVRVKLGAAK
jgi:hypothetical protein